MNFLRQNGQRAQQEGPVRPSNTGDVNVRAPEENVQVEYPTEHYARVQYESGAAFRPQPDPVPVYMTEPPPTGTTLIRWSAYTQTVLGTDKRAQAVAGLDPNRNKLVVRNNSAAGSVYLVRDATDIRAAGFQLAAGKELEMAHTSPVYVFSDEVNDVVISVYAEYGVEDL